MHEGQKSFKHWLQMCARACVCDTCLKYLRENWYMGSISERLAMTKYMTEPRVATGRYLSLAVLIISSVVSASPRRDLIASEVT